MRVSAEGRSEGHDSSLFLLPLKQRISTRTREFHSLPPMQYRYTLPIYDENHYQGFRRRLARPIILPPAHPARAFGIGPDVAEAGWRDRRSRLHATAGKKRSGRGMARIGERDGMC